MKEITLIIILFLFFFKSFSQDYHVYSKEFAPDAEKGYYFKDSVLTNGILIYDETRKMRAKRVVIPQQIHHDASIYTPYDITEYGFPEKVRYVSYNIEVNGNIERVFLEEVIRIDESVSVFCYAGEKNDVFYLYRNKDMIKIDDKNSDELWSEFKKQSECPDLIKDKELPKNLKYRIITNYYFLFKHCNLNGHRPVKYGMTANIGGGKPKGDKDFIPPYKYSGFGIAYSVGFFVQIPIDMLFSFRPEIKFNYLKNNKGEYKVSGGLLNYDGVSQIRRKSLQIPLLFQYNFNQLKGKTIPYIEAGPFLDFVLGGEYEFEYSYSSDITPDKGTILMTMNTKKYHIGISAGAGIEYRLNYHNSIFAGFRYNYSYGRKKSPIEIIDYFYFNLAFSFR